MCLFIIKGELPHILVILVCLSRWIRMLMAYSDIETSYICSKPLPSAELALSISVTDTNDFSQNQWEIFDIQCSLVELTAMSCGTDALGFCACVNMVSIGNCYSCHCVKFNDGFLLFLMVVTMVLSTIYGSGGRPDGPAMWPGRCASRTFRKVALAVRDVINSGDKTSFPCVLI